MKKMKNHHFCKVPLLYIEQIQTYRTGVFQFQTVFPKLLKVQFCKNSIVKKNFGLSKFQGRNFSELLTSKVVH